MSSEYVELIQSLQLGGYIALSCFALAVYELAITLADEIRIVWRGKRNVMSILCAANRWLLLLPVINGLVGALYTSQLSLPSCKAASLLSQILTLLAWTTIALFLAFRVSAIWNLNKAIFLVIFCLDMVPVVTNIYGTSRGSWVVIALPGGVYECTSFYRVSLQVDIAMLYVTRVSAIVADSLAFILTLMKTLSQVRAARRLRGVTVSLSSCIARDGTIYFAALVALNIARLIVSGAPIQVDLSPVTPFLETLPQILINRFIINLRHVADPAVETDLSQASTLGFRIPTTMLGNIAEPLEDGTAQDSTDERLSLPMSSTVYDSEH